VSPKLEERLWNVALWAIKDERSDPEWDDLVSEAVLRAYQSVRCLPEAEASTTRMAHAARWAVDDYRRSARARRRWYRNHDHERRELPDEVPYHWLAEDALGQAPDFQEEALARVWAEGVWRRAARALPPRYYFVLRESIGFGQSDAALAKRMGVCPSRVMQIRKEALARLRRVL